MSALKMSVLVLIFSTLNAGCELKFEPDTVSAILSGNVTSEDGRPVDSVRIRVINWPNLPQFQCRTEPDAPEWGRTDSDGSYEVTLQTGESSTDGYCLGIRFEPAAASGYLPKDTTLTGVVFRETSPAEYRMSVVLTATEAP